MVAILFQPQCVNNNSLLVHATQITDLVVNYGISNTIVLEIP